MHVQVHGGARSVHRLGGCAARRRRTGVKQACPHGLAQRVHEVLMQAGAFEACGAVEHRGLRVGEAHGDLKHAATVQAADGVVEEEAQLQRRLAYGFGLRRPAAGGLRARAWVTRPRSWRSRSAARAGAGASEHKITKAGWV